MQNICFHVEARNEYTFYLEVCLDQTLQADLIA